MSFWRNNWQYIVGGLLYATIVARHGQRGRKAAELGGLTRFVGPDNGSARMLTYAPRQFSDSLVSQNDLSG